MSHTYTFRRDPKRDSIFEKFKRCNRLAKDSDVFDLMLVEVSKKLKLNEIEKNFVFSLHYDISKKNTRLVKHMAYQPSNIRDDIKNMILKNVNSESIVQATNESIKSAKYNKLGKKEISFLKKINKSKNYDLIKLKIQDYMTRVENRLNKKQLMAIDFEEFMRIPKQKPKHEINAIDVDSKPIKIIKRK